MGEFLEVWNGSDDNPSTFIVIVDMVSSSNGFIRGRRVLDGKDDFINTQWYDPVNVRRARIFDRFSQTWHFLRPSQSWTRGFLTSPFQLMRLTKDQFERIVPLCQILPTIFHETPRSILHVNMSSSIFISSPSVSCDSTSKCSLPLSSTKVKETPKATILESAILAADNTNIHDIPSDKETEILITDLKHTTSVALRRSSQGSQDIILNLAEGKELNHDDETDIPSIKRPRLLSTDGKENITEAADEKEKHDTGFVKKDAVEAERSNIIFKDSLLQFPKTDDKVLSFFDNCIAAMHEKESDSDKVLKNEINLNDSLSYTILPPQVYVPSILSSTIIPHIEMKTSYLINRAPNRPPLQNAALDRIRSPFKVQKALKEIESQQQQQQQQHVQSTRLIYDKSQFNSVAGKKNLQSDVQNIDYSKKADNNNDMRSQEIIEMPLKQKFMPEPTSGIFTNNHSSNQFSGRNAHSNSTNVAGAESHDPAPSHLKVKAHLRQSQQHLQYMSNPSFNMQLMNKNVHISSNSNPNTVQNPNRASSASNTRQQQQQYEFLTAPSVMDVTNASTAGSTSNGMDNNNNHNIESAAKTIKSHLNLHQQQQQQFEQHMKSHFLSSQQHSSSSSSQLLHQQTPAPSVLSQSIKKSSNQHLKMHPFLLSSLLPPLRRIPYSPKALVTYVSMSSHVRIPVHILLKTIAILPSSSLIHCFLHSLCVNPTSLTDCSFVYFLSCFPCSPSLLPQPPQPYNHENFIQTLLKFIRKKCKVSEHAALPEPPEDIPPSPIGSMPPLLLPPMPLLSSSSAPPTKKLWHGLLSTIQAIRGASEPIPSLPLPSGANTTSSIHSLFFDSSTVTHDDRESSSVSALGQVSADGALSPSCVEVFRSFPRGSQSIVGRRLFKTQLESCMNDCEQLANFISHRISGCAHVQESLKIFDFTFQMEAIETSFMNLKQKFVSSTLNETSKERELPSAVSIASATNEIELPSQTNTEIVDSVPITNNTILLNAESANVVQQSPAKVDSDSLTKQASLEEPISRQASRLQPRTASSRVKRMLSKRSHLVEIADGSYSFDDFATDIMPVGESIHTVIDDEDSSEETPAFASNTSPLPSHSKLSKSRNEVNTSTMSGADSSFVSGDGFVSCPAPTHINPSSGGVQSFKSSPSNETLNSMASLSHGANSASTSASLSLIAECVSSVYPILFKFAPLPNNSETTPVQTISGRDFHILCNAVEMLITKLTLMSAIAIRFEENSAIATIAPLLLQLCQDFLLLMSELSGRISDIIYRRNICNRLLFESVVQNYFPLKERQASQTKMLSHIEESVLGLQESISEVENGLEIPPEILPEHFSNLSNSEIMKQTTYLLQEKLGKELQLKAEVEKEIVDLDTKFELLHSVGQFLRVCDASMKSDLKAAIGESINLQASKSHSEFEDVLYGAHNVLTKKLETDKSQDSKRSSGLSNSSQFSSYHVNTISSLQGPTTSGVQTAASANTPQPAFINQTIDEMHSLFNSLEMTHVKASLEVIANNKSNNSYINTDNTRTKQEQLDNANCSIKTSEINNNTVDQIIDFKTSPDIINDHLPNDPSTSFSNVAKKSLSKSPSDPLLFFHVAQESKLCQILLSSCRVGSKLRSLAPPIQLGISMFIVDLFPLLLEDPNILVAFVAQPFKVPITLSLLTFKDNTHCILYPDALLLRLTNGNSRARSFFMLEEVKVLDAPARDLLVYPFSIASSDSEALLTFYHTSLIRFLQSALTQATSPLAAVEDETTASGGSASTKINLTDSESSSPIPIPNVTLSNDAPMASIHPRAAINFKSIFQLSSPISSNFQSNVQSSGVNIGPNYPFQQFPQNLLSSINNNGGRSQYSSNQNHGILMALTGSGNGMPQRLDTLMGNVNRHSLLQNVANPGFASLTTNVSYSSTHDEVPLLTTPSAK